MVDADIPRSTVVLLAIVTVVFMLVSAGMLVLASQQQASMVPVARGSMQGEARLTLLPPAKAEVSFTLLPQPEGVGVDVYAS